MEGKVYPYSVDRRAMENKSLIETGCHAGVLPVYISLFYAHIRYGCDQIEYECCVSMHLRVLQSMPVYDHFYTDN